MEFTRNIKRYMTGDDVKYVKDRLVELGYLYASTKNRFGDDSFRATKAFQSANSLESDGVVGELTWNALFGEQPKPSPAVEVPTWIAEPARTEIAQALATVSAKRREIVLNALQFCVDRNAKPTIMRGFYIRGGNLYNKDLSLNVMTKSKLDSYFRKSQYAPYFDEGRESLMRSMAQQSGYTIVGADCSGFIVGLWRKAQVVGTGFDANANHLYSSYCVERKASDILPGDLAWKSGHIGICCSKNFVAESAGGAYGFQLTKRTDRRVLDFRTHKAVKMSGWKKFGDPKVY